MKSSTLDRVESLNKSLTVDIFFKRFKLTMDVVLLRLTWTLALFSLLINDADVLFISFILFNLRGEKQQNKNKKTK